MIANAMKWPTIDTSRGISSIADRHLTARAGRGSGRRYGVMFLFCHTRSRIALGSPFEERITDDGPASVWSPVLRIIG